MQNSSSTDAIDRECMTRAIAAAAQVRCSTAPNPWVGAVIRTEAGRIVEGATQEPGQAHAEVAALAEAESAARGSTMYVTLEPCSHTGRTGPCVDAIIAAGVSRVVMGIIDPDPAVSGSGVKRLRAAGIEVDLGVQADKVTAQLAPYLKHRKTGRPWVVLKLASTLDGGTAAPNGSSQWITGSEARVDGHRLRAESNAIMVGASTIRRDDPSLNVRDYSPPVAPLITPLDPLRIVLGKAAPTARVQPCREMSGDLGLILDQLGSEGILQLLVEGGAGVAGEFHRRGLVDRYVIYIAPALFGGDDANGLFEGAGAWDIGNVWRGRFVAVERVGEDLRVELAAQDAF
ncbi:MAG: bifunctional diaminohydroxyphosphoribosylaminopyrimidine deaminase/5-amino-6-(5-phosphoribosylamino)uracil reductase RibD [Actinomycetes bacterium]